MMMKIKRQKLLISSFSIQDLLLTTQIIYLCKESRDKINHKRTITSIDLEDKL
jgi:hypothetical protein